jgi:UDP-N-acetylglucosamine:LPS N-acetylglucosamine transferase
LSRRVDASLGRAEVLLACSSGGHLLQLLALRPAWQEADRVWVTFDKSDVRSLLVDEQVVYAYGPTNRSIKNLIRNLFLAWRVIGRVRPRVILSTGAGVAVPFAWIGRLRGARVVFVESLTRIDGPSLSCRMIAPVAERVYVQWPELAERYPRAIYRGAVVSRG